MIKMLIVDDSKTELEILKYIFAREKNIAIVGTAQNGKEAIEMVEQLKPNLITMDIQMPVMDGFEAIRHIMRYHPTPIVVISAKLSSKELNATYEALDAGALCVLEKPINIYAPEFNKIKKYMIETIQNMAKIRVTHRLITKVGKSRSFKRSEFYNPTRDQFNLVAVGSSVGGPQALKTILMGLPSFSIPIVVVQHMSAGFISGFARWMNNSVDLKVKEAEHDEVIEGGVVYFAPDNHHLIIKSVRDKLVTSLAKGEPVSGFYPSIDVLFHSVAKACKARAIGLLLTGMGKDGANGLLEMKQSNAHTLIQDEESAVVFGMGKVAQSLGAVDKVVELNDIANYLSELVTPNHSIKSSS